LVGVHVPRRKINYKQFEAALKLMAEKKYAGDDDGLEKLKAKILESGGPVAHGVTVSVSISVPLWQIRILGLFFTPNPDIRILLCRSA